MKTFTMKTHKTSIGESKFFFENCINETTHGNFSSTRRNRDFSKKKKSLLFERVQNANSASKIKMIILYFPYVAVRSSS